MAPVAFLDLNGTLAHSIRRPDDAPLRPLPGALEALALLHQAGIVCAITTVQGRIGRGVLREPDFRTWFAAFSSQVARAGGRLSGLYLCPHPPTARCRCRKPKTGLYEQAAHDLDADMMRSWVVGDTSNDLGAAERVGARAILVRTGYGHLAEFDSTQRDAVVDTVLDAARYICSAVCPRGRLPKSTAAG